jgi:hypothetical protein
LTVTFGTEKIEPNLKENSPNNNLLFAYFSKFFP